jgi:hypothetical protein
VADLKYSVGIETGAAVTAVNALKGQIRALTGMIAGKFTAASLVAFTQSLFQMADEMSDMADNVNISMESLLGFQSAVLPAGVKLDQLTMSMGKLRAVQGDLIKGSGSTDASMNGLAAAFAKLGLPIEQVVAMPLDELIVAIGKAMNDTTSPTEAFSAVCDIFGQRIGPRMTQALRDIGTIGLDGIQAKGKPAADAMSKLAGAADTAEVSINALKIASAEGIDVAAKLWVANTNAIGDYIAALIEGKSMFGALVDAWKGAKEPFKEKPKPPAPPPVAPGDDPAVKALRAREAAEKAKEDEKVAKDRAERIQRLRERLEERPSLSPSRMGDTEIATRLEGSSKKLEDLKFSKGFVDDEEKRLQIALQIRDTEQEIRDLKDEQKKREYDYALARAQQAEDDWKNPEQAAAREATLDTSAPDRFARLGLFIGGAGGPTVDFQRRAAVATELVARNTKRIEEKIATGGNNAATWGS